MCSFPAQRPLFTPLTDSLTEEIPLVFWLREYQKSGFSKQD